jgi:glycosyltransferase involved in cell wall biosynthesis
MNILILSPKFHPIIGGGETFVLNSAKKLHEHGENVTVGVKPIAERNMSDYPFSVCEIDGLCDDKMDIIRAVAGVQELLDSSNFDVIHVHGYFALLIVGLCDTRDSRVVVSIHSTPVWGERIVGGMGSFKTELNFARKVLDLANPSVLTAANEVYSSAALKIAQERVPVVEIPYPVDAEYFKSSNRSLRNQIGLTDDDILLTTPSRIIERKGIKEAVFALSELPENFYLALPAAHQPLDTNYWQSICSTNTFKKVQHRIWIPKKKFLYNEMSSLYGATDIIVMPSYYEGAPVATVEAMTSGKPFVGADSQGINSFIRSMENGVLVPKKAIGQLANAIRDLSQDKKLQQQLSQQAQTDIMYLDWDRQLPKLLSLYSQSRIEAEVSA